MSSLKVAWCENNDAILLTPLVSQLEIGPYLIAIMVGLKGQEATAVPMFESVITMRAEAGAELPTPMASMLSKNESIAERME